ncbi:TPA: hypothetical protein DCW38_04845 [candidate division WOR-3 bacterium]|uniref:YdhG-like domain-containing protein n=1 Tax=candidate division WOR-3 bacterium TaxID=2052148 RepID=A0A350HAC5_UNCW3|nr:hypothetical protein [candidate division WOR-3 bacterium]
MSSTFLTVDEYIDSLSGKAKANATIVRKIIKESAPDAEEGIFYNMPGYKLNGPLVYFASYEKHIGFYPTPSGIETFKRELAIYKSAKGSVQFPLSKPMPLKLISKIVKFRVKDNLRLRVSPS